MENWMKPFKISRMVLGIVGIVLSVLVLFQSCTVFGLSAAIAEEASAGAGAWGMIIALMFLAGSIIQIASRKATTKGAFIATVILFGLAAILGLLLSGSFADLAIWGGICLVYAIVEVVLFILICKKKDALHL